MFHFPHLFIVQRISEWYGSMLQYKYISLSMKFTSPHILVAKTLTRKYDEIENVYMMKLCNNSFFSNLNFIAIITFIPI